MNLEKMYNAQREFRNRVEYEGEDRFDKLVLALMVELGECANEWRGFKFWSKDQEPRTSKYKTYLVQGMHGPQAEWTNPLLEEYVDGLHFVLELGIETENTPKRVSLMKERTTTDLFLTVMEKAIDFDMEPSLWNYCVLFERYIELGEMLGFTWEQIEAAYFEKNQINHQRQENGY
ncbi:dUTP diphosphatase [Bacillus testis]|uniref:dUTP diphosphatase n=1 Tax=Bacillus testis TaxID=1622072 RepID=UPI00067EDADC|nr:dUTP diphosphatase [Bacillus testis]